MLNGSFGLTCISWTSLLGLLAFGNSVLASCYWFLEIYVAGFYFSSHGYVGWIHWDQPIFDRRHPLPIFSFMLNSYYMFEGIFDSWHARPSPFFDLCLVLVTSLASLFLLGFYGFPSLFVLAGDLHPFDTLGVLVLAFYGFLLLFYLSYFYIIVGE